MINVGDIVIVRGGQRTKFFEVIKVEDTYIWVSDGWVQVKREFDKVELVCKAENRQDRKVPLIPFINS